MRVNGQADRQTDRERERQTDMTNSRFSQFCERAQKQIFLFTVLAFQYNFWCSLKMA